MARILRCHNVVDRDFVAGRGCTLTDRDGVRYLDLEAGVWSTPLGHAHPAVTDAIARQAAAVSHLGTAYPGALAARAAEEVARVTGHRDGAVVLLTSGSEVVDLGVKAIRRLTGRTRMVYLAGTFFGSVTSVDSADWTPIASDASPADLDAVAWDQVAGFAFEPGGSAAALVRFPDRPLVTEVARRVRAGGGLVLVNEVTAGIGRTGRWLGSDHYDLRGDLIALGKSLGNGYPVSALSVAAEVADAWERDGFRYVQSHQNDPLGAAVACATLGTIRDGGWIEWGREAGDALAGALRATASACDAVADVRGRGLLLGLELDPHVVSAADVQQRLLAERVLTLAIPAGNLIRLDPALVLSAADIERASDAFASVLAP